MTFYILVRVYIYFVYSIYLFFLREIKGLSIFFIWLSR